MEPTFLRMTAGWGSTGRIRIGGDYSPESLLEWLNVLSPSVEAVASPRGSILGFGGCFEE